MTTGVWTITAADTGGNDWSGSTLKFETQVASNDDWLSRGILNGRVILDILEERISLVLCSLIVLFS